jgi:formate hydrogenlyase subunit 3/multisubunit Na+/H+ antiporter MnhD subunit
MAPLGKTLMIVGLVVALLGFLIWGGSSVPILNRLGRLPGDIYIRRDNFTFYFPITTAIVVSIAISLLLALLRR